jgi:serine/threonine protein kinase
MSIDPSPIPGELNGPPDAYWPDVEEYDRALQTGRDCTPAEWLFEQLTEARRKRLSTLHWLYQARKARADAGAGFVPTEAVAGYEILETAGRGGMAVVYKAWQVRLKRVVALKVLLAGAHAGAAALARFRTEAEAAARLQHPNIVPILEVGEHAGQPYLVLEYADAGSLKQVLDGTPQPARPAARLVEVLARAVHHAHEHHVIHRDLKPANVLLLRRDDPEAIPLGSGDREERRYHPKIADFGLAKQTGEAGTSVSGPTRTGDIIGTPSYMSPEQATGQTQAIGPPADVYALGAILYELLTGRPPFTAETGVETLFQVCSEEPVAPTRLQPKLSRDLNTICLKCLQKDPRKRYASAGALADDLHRFLNDEPILARPEPAWERVVRWARRRRLAAASLALTIVAALALVGVLLWSNAREHQHAVELEKEQKQTAAQQALAKAYLQNALDVLEPLSMDVKGGGAPGPNLDGLHFRQQFVHLARTFYRALLTDIDNPDRDVRRLIGRTFHGLGMSHAVLEETEAAENSFRQAIQRQEQLVKEFPTEVPYRVDLALSYQNLGDTYAARGDKAKAAACFTNIPPLFQTLPVGNDRITRFAEKLSAQLATLGKYQEALAWHNQVIAYLETSLPAETRPDQRKKIACALALGYHLRGLLWKQLGNPAEAVHDFDRALQVKDTGLGFKFTAGWWVLRNVAAAEAATGAKAPPR